MEASKLAFELARHPGWLRLTADPVGERVEPGRWDEYFLGQAAAYARHGLARLVRDARALPREAVFPVLARLEGGGYVGGARLHLRKARTELPIERLFREQPRLEPALRLSADEGICEIAGLWADPRTAGHDLGNRVATVAIGWAAALGCERVIIFAPETRDLYAGLGFAIDPGYPAYPYPDGRYRSRVCRLELGEELRSVPTPYRPLAIRARDAYRAHEPLTFEIRR